MYSTEQVQATILVDNPFFDPETDDTGRECIELRGHGTATKTGNGWDEPYDCEVDIESFELDGAITDRALLSQVFGEDWSSIEDRLIETAIENV